MLDTFHVLLLVHILGAVIGFGPTFAFGIMTSVMRKAPSEGSLWVYEALYSINDKMVFPFLFVQPIVGVLLVFETNRDEHLFQQEWLWISMLLYGVLLGVVLTSDRPRAKRLLVAMRSGDASGPEYDALRARQDRVGMFLGVLVLVILFLMVLKPGA